MKGIDVDDQPLLYPAEEDRIRAIAREEIASLCGLVLRRLQDEHPSRLGERNIAEDVLDEQLGSIFAEALRDFGGADEPGAAT